MPLFACIFFACICCKKSHPTAAHFPLVFISHLSCLLSHAITIKVNHAPRKSSTQFQSHPSIHSFIIHSLLPYSLFVCSIRHVYTLHMFVQHTIAQPPVAYCTTCSSHRYLIVWRVGSNGTIDAATLSNVPRACYNHNKRRAHILQHTWPLQ
jgi:hypothetical protein